MANYKYDRTVVREMLAKGWNNHMIADELGADVQTIRKIRRDLGFPQSNMRRNNRKENTDGTMPVIPAEYHYIRTLNHPAYDENNKCPNCGYRTNMNRHSVCGYILATRKKRPCKPGAECTEFIKGDPEDFGFYML